MSKYTVNIPLVSYYVIEIDASSADEAKSKASALVPSEINVGEYQGWDVDFSNIVANKIEAPDFLKEHFKLIHIA